MECNTITVLEAYQRLGKLINQGKGDLPLIALEGEGKTCNISIDNFVSKVNKDYKLPVINPKDYIVKLLIKFELVNYFEYEFKVTETVWADSKVGDTFEGKYFTLNLDKVSNFFCKQNYNSLPNKIIIEKAN